MEKPYKLFGFLSKVFSLACLKNDPKLNQESTENFPKNPSKSPSQKGPITFHSVTPIDHLNYSKRKAKFHLRSIFKKVQLFNVIQHKFKFSKNSRIFSWLHVRISIGFNVRLETDFYLGIWKLNTKFGQSISAQFSILIQIWIEFPEARWIDRRIEFNWKNEEAKIKKFKKTGFRLKVNFYENLLIGLL